MMASEMASASRRAKNLPTIVRAARAVSPATEPRVCAPSIATPPVSIAGGGGRFLTHAQIRAGMRRRIS
jgi:hypothetical protein